MTDARYTYPLLFLIAFAAPLASTSQNSPLTVKKTITVVSTIAPSTLPDLSQELPLTYHPGDTSEQKITAKPKSKEKSGKSKEKEFARPQVSKKTSMHKAKKAKTSY